MQAAVSACPVVARHSRHGGCAGTEARADEWRWQNAMVSDAEQPRIVAVNGDLCFWRVYQISRDFAGRPADDSGDPMFSVPIGTKGTDSLAVVVGAFPARVRQALLDHRTWGMYFLHRLAGAYGDTPVEELEGAVAALEGQWNLDDLKIGNGLHLTLEMRRTVSLQVNASQRYLWRGDEGSGRPDPREFEEFAKEAAPILDVALAWLLPSLGNRLQLNRLVTGGQRAYLLVPGKAALTMPELKMTAVAGVVSTEPWAEQSWQQLADCLHAYPSRMAKARGLLAVPGRWLALSLGEDDPVRRFLFAYCGLEVLVNNVVSRWRSVLIESLRRDLAGAPVGELLWPTTQDDRYPERNLVFKFAAAATLVSRESAEADTDIFRMIAKRRNGFAHGSANDLEGLPHADAVALLQRYVSAVAAFANSTGRRK